MARIVNYLWLVAILAATVLGYPNALLGIIAFVLVEGVLELKQLRAQLAPMTDIYSEPEPRSTADVVAAALDAKQAVDRAADGVAARLAALKQEQDRRTMDHLRGMRES